MSSREKRPVLIFLLIIVFLIFIFLRLNVKIRKTSSRLFQGFFSHLVAGGIQKPGEIAGQFKSQRALQKENSFLKNQNQELGAKLNNYQYLLKENEELKIFLKFREASLGRFNVVAARILFSSPSNWASTLVLNKGSDDGLKEGQSVISEQGVVGRILEVTSKTSTVLLITDPESSLSSQILRSSVPGVVSGQLGEPMLLNYVVTSADVGEGDEVVTSPNSNYFPAGFKIGKVIKVIKKEKELFAKILVVPATDFSRLNVVFVII